MRALIVGAGAVGQVYGHHLARGGAEVSVYVRPKRRAEAISGTRLTRVRPVGRRLTETFQPVRALTSAAEVAAAGPFEQIWLCVPTTALDEELVRAATAASPRATVVVLAPGHFVAELANRVLGERRTVFGVIGMASYLAPMEGSDDPRETSTPAGIAYFLAMTRLSSASERRALEAVSALRAGGCPAEVVPDASRDGAFGSAALMPVVASLEISGWSFRELREGTTLDLTAAAIDESLAVAAARTGRAPPIPELARSAPALRLASHLARWAPLDIEGFLRVHFVKVGEQTALLLAQNVSEAQRLGLPCAALEQLLAELQAARLTSAPA